MRILAITLDYPPDTLFGSGIANHDLYATLAHAGHEITVLTPGRGRGGRIREPSGVLVVETPEHLTRRHLIPPDRPGESFGDIADIQAWNRACVHWIRQANPTPAPDVIHNHGWVTQDIADHLADHHQVAVVTTAHVIDRHYQALPGDWPRATDSRYQAAEEASFANSTRIILPSRTALDLAAHYYPEHRHKLESVPHGLRWSDFDGHRSAQPRSTEPPETRIVFVGRLGTERSWEPFLRAFRSAADIRGDLRLRVVGHGPGLERGRRQCAHPTVEFLGNLPRHTVLDEVAAADIFCNPALVETFGIAELEAMCLARCVVSGTGFGKHTLVDHLSSGVAIPVHAGADGLSLDERAWTHWLVRLADNKHLRHCLGQQARDVAQRRYTVKRAASGLLDVLEQARDPLGRRLTEA